MNSSPFQKLIYLCSLSLLLLVSCSTPYEPKEEEPGEKREDIENNESVPADATLETVTWNLEWYGDGTYGEDNNGPDNEFQQTKNILKVTDSLKADLYAFQEVYSQQALHDISENMPDYKGFIADHISWIQKTGFVYNTNTIDSLSAGAITDVREAYQQDWEYYWANRYPLYFSFNYNYNGKSTEFYAVVIHAKAHTGESSAEYREAYERRKKAAEGLYYYLQDHKPEANIILLGDYNDDVDESIYYHTEDNYAETPYYQFVNNSDSFTVVSKVLTDNGKQSTVRYDDMIDHITMSNELYSLFVDESSAVFQPTSDFISNYGQTTSDHYPVWAKFDVTKTKLSAK